METWKRLPTGDHSIEWYRSEGAVNYELVNDPYASPDDDATYTYGAEGFPILKDYFTFPTFNVPAGSPITNIKVWGRNRLMVAGGDTHIRQILKVNGVTYNGAEKTVYYGDYTNTQHIWATNPNTGQPWTVDDVNGVGSNPIQAFGYEKFCYRIIRCTQTYIEVNFEAPPPARKPLMRCSTSGKLMRCSTSGKLMRAVEFAFGEDCSCFPAGKTPANYTLTFYDVVLCQYRAWPGDVSLNQKWHLVQVSPPSPCFFRYFDANWLIYLELNVGDYRTWIQAYTPGDPNYHYFQRYIDDPCVMSGVVDNGYDIESCGTYVYGHSGSVLLEPGLK